jgi:hypothetical protein
MLPAPAAPQPGASAAPLAEKPQLRAGVLPPDLQLDGRLDEPAWALADAIAQLTMIEPREGVPASMPTRVRVLADRHFLVVGIECTDPDPTGIVSYSKTRDPELDNEDHVGFVIDPFLDGRSGYVFAVNPDGARFDGLIEPGGEHVNTNWDAIWEAQTARTAAGWSVEFRIPITSISFRRGLTTWHFNVQRYIKRLQETDRWAGARRDWEVTQTSRAGLLTELPAFDLGLGLSVRPALTAGGGVPEEGAAARGSLDPSLDVVQRLGTNLVASLTVRTDFAETEVDTRRTNLTRFPLFFPEKRTFFLEGADLFQFGLGLGNDLVPFFSRRIGLVSGREVPVAGGGKLSGRAGGTSVGALVMRTREAEGLAPAATLGVVRIKQNLWSESWVGAIATGGDPLGRGAAYTAGADFTYATSRFRGDKNFLVGVWGLATGRAGLGGDRSAWGGKVDYPNDRWDVAFTYRRVGRDFDPSLGFVPRRAVHSYNLGMTFAPRPNTWIRQMFYELRPSVTTDLRGRWESYRVFLAPVNYRLESGDRIEFNISPVGERLVEPFEVADGVVIASGTYGWRRYRVEAETAGKRRLSGQVTWWFGGFYNGRLHQIEIEGRWSPSAMFTLEWSAERNIGRLPAGRFVQDLVGVRTQVNFSPDLTVSSFVQYDNESRSLGSNTRLRWTFRPAGELFFIYNHNVVDRLDRWHLESNQLLVKWQYAWRY